MRSETVTTTAFSSGSIGPPAGVAGAVDSAGGVALDIAGDAVGVAGTGTWVDDGRG